MLALILLIQGVKENFSNIFFFFFLAAPHGIAVYSDVSKMAVSENSDPHSAMHTFKKQLEDG